MDKLYINVEKCEIAGGAKNLTPMVQEMDRRLQELASETITIKNTLLKFASTSASEQYKKATLSVYNLSETITEKSYQLNDMQGQIVTYQNNISRFEDNGQIFSNPNPFTVVKTQINVDTSVFKFNLEEMIEVNKCISKYTDNTREILKVLQSNKSSIGFIWKDPQYKDFEMFIDEIVSETNKNIDILEDYSKYLGQKIQELNN